MNFRSSNVGFAVLFTALGVITVLVLPDFQYAGFSLKTLGWIVAAWGLVALIAELVANGTKNSQNNGNLIFREANVIPPCAIAAAGTAILLFSSALLAMLDGSGGWLTEGRLLAFGWIVAGAGTLWLVLECAANGVTRSRNRRQRPGDGGDQGDGRGPIILS